MRIKLELIVFVFLLVFSAVPASAQQKGQYIPGQEGLNTGSFQILDLLMRI